MVYYAETDREKGKFICKIKTNRLETAGQNKLQNAKMSHVWLNLADKAN